MVDVYEVEEKVVDVVEGGEIGEGEVDFVFWVREGEVEEMV